MFKFPKDITDVSTGPRSGRKRKRVVQTVSEKLEEIYTGADNVDFLISWQRVGQK